MIESLVFVSMCGRYVAIYKDKFTSYQVTTNKRGPTASYAQLTTKWLCLGYL